MCLLLLEVTSQEPSLESQFFVWSSRSLKGGLVFHMGGDCWRNLAPRVAPPFPE